MVIGSGGPNYRNVFLSLGSSRARGFARNEGSESHHSFSGEAFIRQILEIEAVDGDLIRSLSGSTRRRLEEHWGREALGKLFSLSQQNNREILFEDLLNLAGQMERESALPKAMRLYGILRQSLSATDLPGMLSRVQGRIDALEGRGAILPRLEVFAKQLVEQATDPAMIAGMGVAGVAFRATRLAALTRLATSPLPQIISRGIPARVLAGAAGFLAEAPAFTAAVRGANQLLGREQDWGRSAVWQEFVSGAVTLLGLKVAGGIAGLGVQRWNAGLQASQMGMGRRIASSLIPQIGTYLGILGSHALETRLGLRNSHAGSSIWVESLATYLNLAVGGRVAHEVMGSGIQRIEHVFEQRSEGLVISLVPEVSGRTRSSPSALRRVASISALLAGGAYLARPAEAQATIRSEMRAPSQEGPSNRGWIAGLGILSLGLGMAKSRRRSSRVSLRPENIRSLPVRDYQNEAIEAFQKHIENSDRGLIVLPTGTGKTTTFSELVGRYLRNPQGRSPRVLILTHRQEILGQNARKLAEVVGAAQVGVFQAGTFDHENTPIDNIDERAVVLASPASLMRGGLNLENFGLVVLDEAHHYVHGNEWFKSLREMGFFNEAGEITRHSDRILAGFTATPDRLNGRPLHSTFGVEGLVFERDITWMIERGNLLAPIGIEVNLQVEGAQDASEALRRANLEDKADIIAETFYERLHHEDKFQRTMVFVSPRTEESAPSEVGIVTARLNREGIRAAGITEESVWRVENNEVVCIKGNEAANARREVIAAYRRGEYDALVNVNIATEGFDDQGTEAVILARATDSRALTVQMIGRALRPDPAHPERTSAQIVDLGGNLSRHRVGADIRQIYRVVPGGSLESQDEETREPRGPRVPEEQVEVGDYEIRDLGQIIGGARRSAFSLSMESLLPTSEAIQHLAYRLGMPSDVLFRYRNGQELPQEWVDVQRLSEAMGDSEAALLDAWAQDQARLLAQRYPIPEGLSEDERVLLQAVREAYYRWARGSLSSELLSGTKVETFRNYMERGEFRTDQFRSNLAEVLTNLLSEGRSKEIVSGWIERAMGSGALARYWQARHTEDLGTLSLEQAQGWFAAVGRHSGRPVDRIVLQFQRKADGRLKCFRPVAPGSENTFYGRLSLRQIGDRFVIESAQGNGTQEVMRLLAARDFVDVASNLRGVLVGEYFQVRREEELGAVTRERMATWFSSVAVTTGAEFVDRIVVQFQRKSDGQLLGFRPVAAGSENTSYNYGRLTLRRGGDRFVIESAQGKGAQEVLRPLVARDIVDIAPNVRGIIFQARHEQELGAVTREQVATWFSAVAATAGGDSVNRIVLQFTRGPDGRLKGFRPVAPGSENTSSSYGRLNLRQSGDRVVIESAQGSGARRVLESLLQSPAATGTNPSLVIEVDPL